MSFKDSLRRPLHEPFLVKKVNELAEDLLRENTPHINDDEVCSEARYCDVCKTLKTQQQKYACDNNRCNKN